ncbi:MAG TPA: hypothetical protein VIS94_05475 [Desulfomonilia bacterium]
MKKKTQKYYNILVFIILILFSCSSNKESSKFYDMNKTIIWNGMKITYPSDRISSYINGDLGLHLISIDTKYVDGLQIIKYSRGPLTFSNIKEFTEGNGNRIIKYGEINYKGNKAFEISYLNNKSKYIYELYVKSINMVFMYQGNENRFSEYKLIINNIELIE